MMYNATFISYLNNSFILFITDFYICIMRKGLHKTYRKGQQYPNIC